MDDNIALPAAIESTPADEKIVVPGDSRLTNGRFRFTSNVVGFLFLVGDVVCFVVSAPITLLAYSLVRGSRVVAPVHLTAFVRTLGSFLLIRTSRQAYRRSLLDLRDSSDTTFDAVISSLIATALIWQGGLVKDYSRGVTLLFLLSVVICLSLSRPLLNKLITRLAANGQIEQRIAFYGADPASVALSKQLLESLHFPHLRFIGIADDRARVSPVADLPMLGDLRELCDMARRGELDQVLISGGKFTRKRLEQIVEGLSEVCVDVSLIPPQAVELAPNYRVNLLGTVPVLTLWQRPLRDMNQVIKRAEDMVFSVIALALLSPILLIAALLVRFSSAGPVLFVQPRVGFNNETINGRAVPAPLQHRRIAAAAERAPGQHVAGRPAAARHRDDGRRPLLSRGRKGLCRAPPDQARNYRLCPGQRSSRRGPDDRARQAPGRTRQTLCRPLVLLA
jgi:polysaccharide biosynthesis protein PslA